MIHAKFSKMATSVIGLESTVRSEQYVGAVNETYTKIDGINYRYIVC